MNNLKMIVIPVKLLLLTVLLSVMLTNCKSNIKDSLSEPLSIQTVQGESLLNTTLISAQLTEKDSSKVARYLSALERYENDPSTVENSIWMGRRMAYLGDYQKAISMYTNALEMFPDEARLYRHRGHRYISVREFDKAIEDLETAKGLIQGTEDKIEPDGIPNRLNTPVSSLHTNVYYHLGLAFYLKADWQNALTNYQLCLEASTNDDMRVAASHWLYMILQRMDQEEAAKKILEPIQTNMNIIENDGYHQLLLFYKGELAEDALQGNGSAGASEAVLYGLAHWYQYNNQKDIAISKYRDLIANGNWAGFGYIAAEAELSRMPKL